MQNPTFPQYTSLWQQPMPESVPPSTRRLRHRPTRAEIERILDQADAMLDAGAVVPEVCRALGISPRLYDQWRSRQQAGI